MDQGNTASGAVGWTAADQAELEVLLWELLRSYDDHREHHEGCDPMRCPALGNAIQVVLDWRRMRELLSHAEWLRAQRELFEQNVAA